MKSRDKNFEPVPHSTIMSDFNFKTNKWMCEEGIEEEKFRLTQIRCLTTYYFNQEKVKISIDRDSR